jgi:hypothetical protein
MSIMMIHKSACSIAFTLAVTNYSHSITAKRIGLRDGNQANNKAIKFKKDLDELLRPQPTGGLEDRLEDPVTFQNQQAAINNQQNLILTVQQQLLQQNAQNGDSNELVQLFLPFQNNEEDQQLAENLMVAESNAREIKDVQKQRNEVLRRIEAHHMRTNATLQTVIREQWARWMRLKEMVNWWASHDAFEKSGT